MSPLNISAFEPIILNHLSLIKFLKNNLKSILFFVIIFKSSLSSIFSVLTLHKAEISSNLYILSSSPFKINGLEYFRFIMIYLYSHHFRILSKFLPNYFHLLVLITVV